MRPPCFSAVPKYRPQHPRRIWLPIPPPTLLALPRAALLATASIPPSLRPAPAGAAGEDFAGAAEQAAAGLLMRRWGALAQLRGGSPLRLPAAVVAPVVGGAEGGLGAGRLAA